MEKVRDIWPERRELFDPRVNHPMIMEIDDQVRIAARTSNRLITLGREFVSPIGENFVGIEWYEELPIDKKLREEIINDPVFRSYLNPRANNLFTLRTDVYRVLIVQNRQTKMLELLKSSSDPFVFTPDSVDPAELQEQIWEAIEKEPFLAEVHVEGDQGFIHIFQKYTDLVAELKRKEFKGSIID